MIALGEYQAAKALATIEKERAHVLSGYASAQAWAEANGFGDQQARRLLAVGRTLEAAPELERKMRSGYVPSDSVHALGKVLLEPAMELTAPERRIWLEKACALPPQQLREEAIRAVEDARQRETTYPMRFHVTRTAKEGFQRSRLLMSKGQPRLISEGQTFGRLVDDWLDTHDPRRKPLPKRRSGPTRGTRSRYRPRQVDALVEQRSGGTCEICGVRRAIEKIHLKETHAQGGSREVVNLADSCRECHVMVDAGVFRFSHFDEQGRPRFTFHHGPQQGDQPAEVREPAPPDYAARGSRLGLDPFRVTVPAATPARPATRWPGKATPPPRTAPRRGASRVDSGRAVFREAVLPAARAPSPVALVGPRARQAGAKQLGR